MSTSLSSTSSSNATKTDSTAPVGAAPVGTFTDDSTTFSDFVFKALPTTFSPVGESATSTDSAPRLMATSSISPSIAVGISSASSTSVQISSSSVPPTLKSQRVASSSLAAAPSISTSCTTSANATSNSAALTVANTSAMPSANVSLTSNVAANHESIPIILSSFTAPAAPTAPPSLIGQAQHYQAIPSSMVAISGAESASAPTPAPAPSLQPSVSSRPIAVLSPSSSLLPSLAVDEAAANPAVPNKAGTGTADIRRVTVVSIPTASPMYTGVATAVHVPLRSELGGLVVAITIVVFMG
ncbi:hypothetical protein EPUS_05709 [Endocarpon pusillum Z07020]|uniref:Uncharacterized protein n=1 Tax=Endocarpon pusillum (strain Z07020 / HMAS-L-300199) TaxID=1263415 RepID=U1HQH2_ENDPU|nr:uncharacterized protein EPUS_05709 [Endocarpon pusillum Z07020]ERF72655.1 hypothetical protein EPUS_05709 [Endocarpon pusillum Z07020]